MKERKPEAASKPRRAHVSQLADSQEAQTADDEDIHVHSDEEITSGRGESEPIRKTINKHAAKKSKFRELQDEMMAKAFHTTEDWKERLSLRVSQMYPYSPANQTRIASQLIANRDDSLPTATGAVLPKSKWEAMGGTIREDAQPLYIMAARKWKRTEINEQGEEETTAGMSFQTNKNTRIYDFADVEGIPPEKVFPYSKIKGTPEAVEAARNDLDVVASNLGIDIEEGDPAMFLAKGVGLGGYFSRKENKIVVRAGTPPEQAVAVIAHELGHACDPSLVAATKAEAENGNVGEYYQKNRDSCEVVAESTAYAILREYGIDSSEGSYNYINHWLPKTTKMGRNIENRVSNAVTRIQNGGRDLYDKDKKLDGSNYGKHRQGAAGN